jgi:hypothetical protein
LAAIFCKPSNDSAHRENIRIELVNLSMLDVRLKKHAWRLVLTMLAFVEERERWSATQ